MFVVFDAPADVLVAKWFSEVNNDTNLCEGMVAVATGLYSTDDLIKVAGAAVPGKWKPVILNDGLSDPDF